MDKDQVLETPLRLPALRCWDCGKLHAATITTTGEINYRRHGPNGTCGRRAETPPPTKPEPPTRKGLTHSSHLRVREALVFVERASSAWSEVAPPVGDTRLRGAFGAVEPLLGKVQDLLRILGEAPKVIG